MKYNRRSSLLNFRYRASYSRRLDFKEEAEAKFTELIDRISERIGVIIASGISLEPVKSVGDGEYLIAKTFYIKNDTMLDLYIVTDKYARGSSSNNLTYTKKDGKYVVVEATYILSETNDGRWVREVADEINLALRK